MKPTMPQCRSAQLPVMLSADAAKDIAGQAWRMKLPEAEYVLSYFPLLGVVFTLDALRRRGPAAKLHGNRFSAVVDRTSGTAVVTSWDHTTLIAPGDTDPRIRSMDATRIAPETLSLRYTIEQSVDVARQVLLTVLLRKLKLAASFQLECVTCIWPLWKPNWLIKSTQVDALVDALNGNVVFQQHNSI